MSENKSNLVLNELNNVLEEMCEFINSILTKLPPDIQKKAISLIQKTYRITKTEVSAYLNMDRRKSIESISEYVEPDMKETPTILTESQEIEKYEIPNQPEPIIENPQVQLSAQEVAPISRKHGYLDRQFNIFYIKMFRKCYCVVLDNTMLMYVTANDKRPDQELNLIDYVAKPIQKDNKNSLFEIKPVLEESRKSYVFDSRSYKDMEQWVSAINTPKDKTSRDLPSLPPSSSNDYEIINTTNDDQDEAIYSTVDQSFSSKRSSIQKDISEEETYDDVATIKAVYANKLPEIPKISNLPTKRVNINMKPPTNAVINPRKVLSGMLKNQETYEDDFFEQYDTVDEVKKFRNTNSFLHSCKLK